MVLIKQSFCLGKLHNFFCCCRAIYRGRWMSASWLIWKYVYTLWAKVGWDIWCDIWVHT